MEESIKPKYEVKGYIKGIIHTKGEVSTFKTEGVIAIQKNASFTKNIFFKPFNYTLYLNSF